jgi:hypothetical protein
MISLQERNFLNVALDAGKKANAGRSGLDKSLKMVSFVLLSSGID